MNLLLAGKYFTGDNPLNKEIIKFLKEKNFNTYLTEDKFDLSFLKQKKIDMIINSGYGPIIKDDILIYYKNKVINMHNSFLPNGRGIYPNLWSIFCNYQSGITLCYVDNGIDNGDIIFQKKINFLDNITLFGSWKKLQIELSMSLINNWELICNIKNPIKQNDIDIKPSYHERKYSEILLKLLPDKWNSKHKDVKEIARKYDFSYENFVSSFQKQ